MRKRKTYTPAQKLHAALDLFKGDRTAVDIARDIGCHPTVIDDPKDTLEKKRL